MTAAKKKLHKDWFDKDAARAMAAQLASADKTFDKDKFVRQCCKGLTTLEFHARLTQFADAMAAALPQDYCKAIAIVQRSLPEPLPNCDSITDGWLQWPVGRFIADRGLEHFDESMECMVELTKRFTAEYAIRPFITIYPKETFDYLYRYVEDANPHVRRWCSEGSRTRLPWGGNLNALIADPSPILTVLEALKDDDELYVRKSVANSLNDLSRDHPEMVVKICKRWSKGSSPARKWLINHAMRTLIKQGNPAALKLSGFRAAEGITTELSLARKRIKIGESAELQARLENTGSSKQKLLLDYVVGFQGKKDKVRRKVFKWKTLELAAGELITLSKQHPMRQTTVRALYPGKHTVELQLNGQLRETQTFALSA
ncbi:MAG: hypothetical protein AB8B63_14810 [Granulosicoccus sp.]